MHFLQRVFDNFERNVAFAFLALAFAAIATKLFFAESFLYVLWSDRDIIRASQLSEVFWVTGSELQAREGLRVPGGLIHYMGWLLIQLHPSPLFIQTLLFISTLVTSFILVDLGRRLGSPLAGLLAVTIYITSGIVLGAIGIFQNVVFGAPFLILGFYFLSRFVLDRRELFLYLFVGCAVVSAQMQMAALYLLLIGLIYVVLFARPVFWRTWIICALIPVGLYAPWLLNQAFGVFEQTYLVPDVAANYTLEDGNVLGQVVSLIQRLPHHLGTSFSFGEFASISGAQIVPFGALLMAAAGYILVQRKLDYSAPESAEFVVHMRLRTFIGFASFMAVCFVVFFGMTGFFLHGIGIKPRYVLPFSPALAMLSGLGIALILREGLRGSGTFPVRMVPFALAMILLAVIGLRSAVGIYSDIRRVDHGIGQQQTYRDAVAMLSTFHTAFGYSSLDIAERGSFVYRDENGWQQTVTPMQYLMDYLAFERDASAFNGCVVAVARQPLDDVSESFTDDEAKTAVQLLLEQEFASFPPDAGGFDLNSVEIKKVVPETKFVQVGFTWPFADCPRSFQNPYTLSDAEVDIERATRNPSSQGIQSGDTADAFSVYGVINAPDVTRFPITARMDVSVAGAESLRLTLHSKSLRNGRALLNGYWQEIHAKASRIEITDSATGSVNSTYLYPGTLGKAGFQSPWSVSVKLPSGGPISMRLGLDIEGQTYWMPILTDWRPGELPPPANSQ